MGCTPENGGAVIDPMLPVPYRIVKRVRETADTFTCDVEPVSGAIRGFRPGQFNMLYTFGIGEVPISISGNPGDDGRLVHTIRAVGAVTNALGRLKAGDQVGLRGPFGSNWPVEEARGGDVVIVAGGIGLAPLRPAIYSVLERREEYGSVCVLYGSRTPDDLIFRQEVARWRSRFDLHVYVTVDHAIGDWRGNVGVVTPLIGRASFDASKATAMVCGPEIMMRFAIRELIARGVAENRIFLSMERNMKCAVGFCGHCQYGPEFVCKDGPVFNYERVKRLFAIREV